MAARNNVITEVTFNFRDRDWHQCPPNKMRQLEIWGNDMWTNPTLSIVALVAYRSTRYPEFAVSEAGLNFISDAVKDGKIESGFVILKERHDGSKLVIALPVAEVVASLEGIAPRQESGSPYWWLCENGEPYAKPIPKNSLFWG
jgi:hypothetical protein